MAVVARRRPRPVVIILALVSVTLIGLDRSGQFGPTRELRSVVRDASSSIGSTVNGLSPFDDSDRVKALERERNALQQQLDSARTQLAGSADAERERQSLLTLLALPTPDGVGRVVARVTAADTSNFDSTIEIGRGSDAGIATGMPVVSAQGLVGRVVRTSGKGATVLLVSDTTSNVSVRFGGTGEIGLAVGQGGSKPMRVDLIDATSSIKAGDVAVTSGQQHSRFPPGLVVGAVKSVSAGPQEMRKQVELEPLSKTTNLNEVAVLQWNPPA